MFRNVPACSGMFRVPGFIDGLVYMAAGIFHKKCGMSAAFVSACVNRALNVRSCFRFCAGRGSWGVSTVPETFHARFPVSVKSLQFVSAFG